MAAINIRIDTEIKRRLEDIAAVSRTNISQIVREALAEKIEELEDYLTVKSRLAKPFDTVSNDEVWKHLGL